MPQVPERDIPRKNLFKRRRIAVIVVPPVEELDLVGPMQVFSAANRLTGKPVYAVEIATNAAFLFAEAGLLNGRRATAHSKFGAELAKRYPRVRVESNPLWVKDGNI